MSFRAKFALILLSATLALYTVVGGWISTRAQQPANDPNAQLRIFESVLQHIQNDYVDEPNMEKVRAGALRGLAYGLDPIRHTSLRTRFVSIAEPEGTIRSESAPKCRKSPHICMSLRP